MAKAGGLIAHMIISLYIVRRILDSNGSLTFHNNKPLKNKIFQQDKVPGSLGVVDYLLVMFAAGLRTN